MAGLELAHVEQFEALGFERTKVVRHLVLFSLRRGFSSCAQIDVLRRLNYRGVNVSNITEDRVVEELLK